LIAESRKQQFDVNFPMWVNELSIKEEKEEDYEKRRNFANQEKVPQLAMFRCCSG